MSAVAAREIAQATGPLQIAVYGKGGIGKSTISANLSAALAKEGQSVLQIGCDPKHDSTRLLLGGEKVVTALDYLRQTPAAEQRSDQLLHRGYGDVDCIEAGGPEPGVGCAGRGILSMFSLLDRLTIDRTRYDTVLYDVLGDVVCGGFAVPLRREYANTVLLVTSEEFMPIYAANNILRGIQNFDAEGARIAGLIVNLREREPDLDAINRFANAVRVPILATLPRSQVIRQAEQLGKTLIEAFPDSDEAQVFQRLAERLVAGVDLYRALPLGEAVLETLVLSRASPTRNVDAPPSATHHTEPPSPPQPDVPAATAPEPERPRYIRTKLPTLTPYYYRSPPSRPPVQGCAYTGAVMLTTQIRDAVTVSHSPRSCAHMNRHYLHNGAHRALVRHDTLLPEKLAPALVSTDMDQDAMVYGGNERLVATLRQVLSARPPVVFVVTACPPGLIGDDLELAIAQAQTVSPATRIIPLELDGNLSGGFSEGWLDACQRGAAALIDSSREPAEDRVNLVGESTHGRGELNYRQVETLLQSLGLRVNTRFVQRTSVASLEDFCRGRLNLLAGTGFANRQLADFLRDRFGAVFAEQTFPIGFHQTERWLLEIARYFGRLAAVERVLTDLRLEYLAGLEASRSALRGKRLMLLVTHATDVDWVLETAFDCGMQVAQLAVLRLPEESDFRTRYADRIEVRFGYRPEQQTEDIEHLKPDLVLSGFNRQELPPLTRYDTFPPSPPVGPQANLELAQRWGRLLKAPLVEGWKQDAGLFR